MLARDLGVGCLGMSVSNKSIFGFEFLDGIDRVVDEGKSSSLSTTELGLEAKDNDILK